MVKKKFSPLPFSCPSCGSYMLFKAGNYRLECINCKVTKAVDIKSYNFNRKREFQRLNFNRVVRVVECFGCGAEVDFEEFMLSRRCQYCKTPLVTKPLNSPQISALIPFNIDEKRAREIFKKWLGSLWFAPNELKSLLNFEQRFIATYIPYFSFDSSTYSIYRGYRGDAYYVTVQRRAIIDGREQIVEVQERRINWTPVSGSISRVFRDILVEAKESLPKAIKGLKFNPSQLVEFNPSFLSGYRGYEYDRELESAFLEAKSYIDSTIYRAVIWDIGGDEQRVESISTEYNNKKFDIYLMPAFIGKFKFKNREYSVIIDGAEGKIVGERPYSYIKIALLVVTLLLIFATLLYFEQNGGDFETYIDYRPYIP